MKPLRPEEIYDAATDDEAFGQLATAFARAVDARSAVFHWRDSEACTEEVSYSGHFSDEQMGVFERHFAADDLWSAAVQRSGRVNCIWDCEQLVPARDYERGRLYNEWIRPMGDDTFRALGGVLVTDRAAGEIGIHRGRGQPPFDSETVARVEDALVHLRRMLAIRSKLVASRRHVADASAGLDAIGYALFTVDSIGRLLHANAAAEAVLERADGLTLRDNCVRALRPADQKVLQAAIDRALAREGGEAGALLVRRQAARPYELSVLAAHQAGLRRVVIVLADPDMRDLSLPLRLRELYGLTAAEAGVTVRLAEGAPPSAIAEERGVSLATIQSQLKAIFAKTGCRRQSELVTVVGNLPRLRLRC